MRAAQKYQNRTAARNDERNNDGNDKFQSRTVAHLDPHRTDRAAPPHDLVTRLIP